MWVSGSSLLQGMFVSTSEFLGVLSVLAHVVCRLAGVLATCQFILKTPILRTDDPSCQHRPRFRGIYQWRPAQEESVKQLIATRRAERQGRSQQVTCTGYLGYPF